MCLYPPGLQPHKARACHPCTSPQAALTVEDDSLYEEGAEIPETGYVDEKGELRRPWCAATRILEHREMVGGVGLLWCNQLQLGLIVPR